MKDLNPLSAYLVSEYSGAMSLANCSVTGVLSEVSRKYYQEHLVEIKILAGYSGSMNFQIKYYISR